MTFSFFPGLVTIQVLEQGKPVEREMSAVIAEGVGLAYVQEVDDVDGPGFSLTHVVTGTSLGNDWLATSEQEAQAWIAQLNEVVDWTGRLPRMRPGQAGKTLSLITIGALHEVSEKHEGS